MLNRQRCILCTRCVRFMRDVDGDAQINIIDRGYGSEIATFQEEGVHSLISGNLMDVCPVGAITTRDYRFKSRPWDNPNAADTICTICSKGCNTTAWLKAKPEWAKGSRLIRITPRFNPDVNGYWMCDIGRFDYHWIESDDRLRRPLVRDARRTRSPSSWHELTVGAAGRGWRRPASANPDGVRFLLSAHASHEELFLFRRLAEELLGPNGPRRDRGQLARQRRRRSPNARRSRCRRSTRRTSTARACSGWRAGRAAIAGRGRPVARCERAVEAGQVVGALRVRPGSGRLARRHRSGSSTRAQSGTLPLLIVQGVLLTELARAADFVLPGASSVEKEASYTNDQGRLQGTARAMPLPGEAMEDWQILVEPRRRARRAVRLRERRAGPRGHRGAVRRRARAGGTADAGVRAAGRRAAPGCRRRTRRSAGSGISCIRICRPSKGPVDLVALPPPPGVIPLREVK